VKGGSLTNVSFRVRRFDFDAPFGVTQGLLVVAEAEMSGTAVGHAQKIFSVQIDGTSVLLNGVLPIASLKGCVSFIARLKKEGKVEDSR